MVPIYIGLAEAISIDIALRNETTPRPMTHDLMKSVMDNFNINIDRILIDDLDEQVFYARLMLKDTDKDIEIDARPSDCIALAVRTKRQHFHRARDPGQGRREQPGHRGGRQPGRVLRIG